MKYAVIITAVFIIGCTPMTHSQKLEYQVMQDEGVLVEEKNPGAGIALGFLPGGGSFYARRPGIGVLDLLLWPLSIIWDPIVGYNDSKKINYDITKAKIQRWEKRELNDLENRHDLGQIGDTEYIIERREIQRKYDYETYLD